MPSPAARFRDPLPGSQALLWAGRSQGVRTLPWVVKGPAATRSGSGDASTQVDAASSGTVILLLFKGQRT